MPGSGLSAAGALAVALGLALTASLATAPVAAEPGVGDVIVVTGVRPRPLASVPRSVTVIGADDIAASPATGLADLLAAEANLNLRSVTGNDKFAGVDIRGMGDTWVSNVLVLVDGVRLNPPDLAGPDLASVSLQQVERIEIVRGANAVRYGGGAEVTLADDGACVRIVVRDHGPGLPEAELERVFEPFYRAEASRNRQSGGVGLGLSIARDIAERHGGSLQLHNAEGGGLRATLVLPRANLLLNE